MRFRADRSVLHHDRISDFVREDAGCRNDDTVLSAPGRLCHWSAGVPGGTVMASLGLITGILGFDETGTALMLTIFALQDSFGTACNITGGRAR